MYRFLLLQKKIKNRIKFRSFYVTALVKYGISWFSKYEIVSLFR